MKTTKKNLLATLMLSSAVLVGAGVGFGVSNDYVAAAQEGVKLASMEMLGAQLRIDGTHGVRFVMAMDEADYATYSANKDYSVGVLLMPSDLIGDDGVLDINDVNDINGAQQVSFDGYQPKLIDGTYRFNAVLTGIEANNYTRDITAVGYLADASGEEVVYTYTEAIVRDVTRVASSNLGDYDEVEQADKYESVATYILSAYNQTFETNYATIDELVQAEPLKLTMDGNEIACIMMNNEVIEGYDNIINSNLSEFFDITYSTKSKNIKVNAKTGEVTATGTQNYDEENGKGAATVTATTLGGKLSAEFDLTVMDEVIWKNNYGKASNGSWGGVINEASPINTFLVNNMEPTSAFSFFATATSNTINTSGAKAYYTEEDTNEVVVEAYEKGFVKEGDKVFAWTNTKGLQNYRPRLAYDKEQIAYLLAQGYDRVVIPVYMQVNAADIPTTFVNGINRTDLWVANQDLKNLTVDAARRNYSFYGATTTTVNKSGNSYKVEGYSNSSLYFNQWTNVTISLQVIYDNYDKFDYDNAANSVETWALFSFNLCTAGRADIAIPNKTVYMGNMYVAKDTFVDEDVENGKYYIDYTNPDILNKVTFATAAKGTAATNYYVSTGFAVQTIGEKGLYTGTVAGRTGSFLELTNVDYASGGIGGFTNNAAKNQMPLTSAYLYLGSVITKAKLVELQENGYSALSLDLAYTRQNGATATTPHTTVPSIRSSYYKVNNNLVITNFTDKWITYSLPIQHLIDNYEVYFNDNDFCQYTANNTLKTAETGLHKDLFYIAQLSGTSWTNLAITNIYVDNLCFVK